MWTNYPGWGSTSLGWEELSWVERGGNTAKNRTLANRDGVNTLILK